GDWVRRKRGAQKRRDKPILGRLVKEARQIQPPVLGNIARESLGRCHKIRQRSREKDWSHVLAQSHEISWLSRRIACFNPAGRGVRRQLGEQGSSLVLSREPAFIQ